MTPGVVTDIVGLSLLIPGARGFAADRIRQSLEKRFEIQSIGPGMAGMAGMNAMFARGEDEAAPRGEVIDVDAREPEPRSAEF